MVAEVGEIQVDCLQGVPGKPPDKSPAEKLTAKRAVMLARKRSTSSSIKTLSKLNQQTTGTDDAAAAEKKKKKKKKFVPAPWLCEGMKVVSTAPIRSDLDDAMAAIEGKHVQPGSEDIDESEAFDIVELELTMLHRMRLKKKMRLMHQVKNIPDLNYVTRRKLVDRIIKVGNKNVINNNVMSRLKAQDDEIAYAKERRNDNTSWMLNHLGLRKRSDLEQLLKPTKVKQSAESSTSKPKPNYTRTKRVKGGHRNYPPARKPRWTEEQKERQVYIPHEYELVTEAVDHDDPEETNLLCFLLDLQHREMTPEDYDMLLRLDEKVGPKTVEAEKLSSLRTETVSDVGTGGPMEGILWEDSLCAVCMEPYEKDQTVKFLRCEHFFHSNCIEMWLNNSGCTCPLDGLEV